MKTLYTNVVAFIIAHPKTSLIIAGILIVGAILFFHI